MLSNQYTKNTHHFYYSINIIIFHDARHVPRFTYRKESETEPNRPNQTEPNRLISEPAGT